MTSTSDSVGTTASKRSDLQSSRHGRKMIQDSEYLKGKNSNRTLASWIVINCCRGPTLWVGICLECIQVFEHVDVEVVLSCLYANSQLNSWFSLSRVLLGDSLSIFLAFGDQWSVILVLKQIHQTACSMPHLKQQINPLSKSADLDWMVFESTISYKHFHPINFWSIRTTPRQPSTHLIAV